MTEQLFPVKPDQTRVRVQFEASEGLRKAVELLIKPEHQKLFGNKTLHVIALETMVDITHDDQFVTEQDRRYDEYVQRIWNLHDTQYTLQPRVRFDHGSRRALHVKMWPTMSYSAQQEILSPPLYRSGIDVDFPLGLQVRLSNRDVLHGPMLGAAEGDVRAAFSKPQYPTVQESERLYVHHLEVVEVPFVIPHPRDGAD